MNSGKINLSMAIKVAWVIIHEIIRVIKDILNNGLTMDALISFLELFLKLFLRVS